MTNISSDNPRHVQNRLLAALPAENINNVLAKADEVELVFDSKIYELGDEYQYVYFPNGGIISLLAAVDSQSTLEVGMVGSEGMAGLPYFLGAKTSRSQAIVQGSGTAMRLSTADLDAACANDPLLSRILMHYANQMIVQVSQSAACYRFHAIEQRLARWLLMTCDRMETNDFRITQDFLSNMLGVRREAVNRAAGSLQKAGLISYSRGKIFIIDRPGLEAAACSCYAVIREEEIV